MSNFTNTSLKVLVAGAIILGAGIYYQGVSSQGLKEARQAKQRVGSALVQAETAKERAKQYVTLLERMTNNNVDRQEPFAVVSEFSPQEISELGPLLDTLYQRDGHFFLQRFEMSWQQASEKLGLLPRVALVLEGQKVLLFSNEASSTSPVTTNNR